MVVSSPTLTPVTVSVVEAVYDELQAQVKVENEAKAQEKVYDLGIRTNSK